MEADDKRSAGAPPPDEPGEDEPIGEVAADEGGLGGEGPTPSVLEDFGPTAVPPAEDVATGFEEVEDHEPEAAADAGDAASDAGDAASEADPARARRLRSVVESLLFAAGDPVTLARLAQVLPAYDKREIARTLADLGDEYQQGERGFRLVQVAGGWQLRTSRANVDFVRAFLQQRPARLSRAALETLAVVAYRQPVTRPEIEAIRGVDVGGVLALLLERKLLKVIGRKEVVGRPLLYGTTQEFLEAFALKDLSALPTLDELGESAERLERAAAAAAEELERAQADAESRTTSRSAEDVEPAPAEVLGEADGETVLEDEAPAEPAGDDGDGTPRRGD